jgi:hypothetical protein
MSLENFIELNREYEASDNHYIKAAPCETAILQGHGKTPVFSMKVSSIK